MKTPSVSTSRRTLIGLTVLAFTLLAAFSAKAQLYNDITNFTGFGYSNGGAANSGGTFITTMVADNLMLTSGSAGQSVTGFTFSVANFNSSTVSARPLIRFYSNDGSGGGPGTFLTGFDLVPIAFGAGSVGTFTFNPALPLFVVPASGIIWAGIVFDNLGTTATQAQLNNLGQGIFNPPTVGSSTDAFFQTSAAGSFAGNNPAGGFLNFGGSPVANFGWALNGTPATGGTGGGGVPEGGNTVLLLLLGCSALAVARRHSQRSSCAAVNRAA